MLPHTELCNCENDQELCAIMSSEGFFGLFLVWVFVCLFVYWLVFVCLFICSGFLCFVGFVWLVGWGGWWCLFVGGFFVVRSIIFEKDPCFTAMGYTLSNVHMNNITPQTKNTFCCLIHVPSRGRSRPCRQSCPQQEPLPNAAGELLAHTPGEPRARSACTMGAGNMGVHLSS